MTLKFSGFRVVVKEHVRAKLHRAKCSGLRVILNTDKKLGRKHYSPSLRRFLLEIRDAREWLFTFPLPPIPVQSIPIPSHSQFCNQFPFSWDSHKAFSVPSHSHSRTLRRCSINYFGAREDSSLNMPLKLTISCVHFYSTETRNIVVENIISFYL